MAITPAAVTLPMRRNAPFVEEFEFTDDDGVLIDFTGYTASLQIRLYGGQPGSALIDLDMVNDDSQGVRLMDPNTWRVVVDEQAINNLPGADEAGDAEEFVFDWRFDDGAPLGVSVWVEGVAKVQPGVTK